MEFAEKAPLSFNHNNKYILSEKYADRIERIYREISFIQKHQFILIKLFIKDPIQTIYVYMYFTKNFFKILYC